MFQVVYDTIRVYLFDPHSIPVECELESLYEESLWFLNALQGDLPQPGKGNLSMDDIGPWDDLMSCCVCHHWASKGISTLSCTLNLKRIVGYRNPGWKEKKNWLEATQRGSGAASTKKSASLLFFHRMKDTDRNLQRHTSSHQRPVSVVICTLSKWRLENPRMRSSAALYPSAYRRLSNPTST